MTVTEVTYIGDPQIVVHDGKYYCYATSFIRGFNVRVSDDLVTWSAPILCYDGNQEKSWGYDLFWAPEVVYHNGKFIMHYSAKSEKLQSLRIGVAVSDSPTGPFIDVYDHPMFDFGYAAIDGSILCTDKGNYLYYSRDCSEHFIDGIRTSEIYCVQLDETLTKTVGEGKLMTTPTYPFEKKSLSMGHLWNEGPCVIKLGDEYIMNYSANCFATNDYAICIATAKDPMGPWKKSANNPVLSRRGDLFGAGHNAFFTDLNGELCTSFHIQTNPENPGEDRRTVVGKVKFGKANGEIFQTIE